MLAIIIPLFISMNSSPVVRESPGKGRAAYMITNFLKNFK